MLTLFSTPKPFRGHAAIIQKNALRSWKQLGENVEVILFGDDDGAAAVCRELGLRHEPHVTTSASGAKRLDSLFLRAQEIATHDFLCYANCDIIFTQELLLAMQQLLAWRPSFLMVGRRWDTAITEPIDFSDPHWEPKLLARAQTEGTLRFYHNIDYFLFPRGLYPKIPPLVIGRIYWDHWLVGKALQTGTPAVDVSEVVCAVHQNHDYAYHPQGIEGVWKDQEAARNKQLGRRDSRLATIEDAPYRLTKHGIARNRLCWLAPARRIFRAAYKPVRRALRLGIWHPLLDLTRPLRHALGLKKSALAQSPPAAERKHWMDQ